jgi:energy-coupling factor transporter ATP-binding protein EcfA2
MSYQPPQTLWEVSDQLRYDEPLEADDPRFVETELARGATYNSNLLRHLGVEPNSLVLKKARSDCYTLYCGHRGSGKSTELRRLTKKLHGAEKYWVVFLDVVRELDTNNLQVADVLLTLARQLLKRLEDEQINLDQVFLTRLENWFKERIESHAATKEFASDVQAGASAKSGIPFIGELFAAITNSFKVNSTHKEELRRIIKNSFTEFADSFNLLIEAAETELKKQGKGQKLIFIIDGTDRLDGADSRRFFLTDVHQLQLIRSNFVYCAPIYLTHEGSQIHQSFSLVFRLPMIKLSEKQSASPIDQGYSTMRKIIYRRADRHLFDLETTVDYLIQYSGGHPRDLLRLLNYAFQLAEGELFNQDAAEKAVKKLATEYRRILEAQDYSLLREVDRAPPERAQNSEETRKLLFNLALLEYDDYWWQSHPAIRTLPDYQATSD